MLSNNTDNAHILVIDDDEKIRRMLRRYLESEGFSIVEAESSKTMEDAFSRHKFGLVLLDLNLGSENGLELAKQIQVSNPTPIIFVTGKGDVVDRVVGLEMGAEDYITKPFHLREVLARIRTVLRRTTGGALTETETQEPDVNCFRFAGWCFHEDQRKLVSPSGETTPLTTAEHDLLVTFLSRPNRALSRDQLMDLLHGRDWAPYDRSLDTQVARLRKKIETVPSKPEFIKTVRGVGYIFASTVEKA